MKNSVFLAMSLAGALLAFAPLALSHGSLEPEHGGVVQQEHELVFELVREEAGVSLYIKDHGEPYSTASLSGDIMVLSAGSKTQAALMPAGANKMSADIVIADGAKVLVKVKSGDHHPVTVRYSF